MRPPASAGGRFLLPPSMAATPPGPSLRDVKNVLLLFFVAAVHGGNPFGAIAARCQNLVPYRFLC